MLPKKQGLYSPDYEHDNCGAGFICSLRGEKTNNIIPKALNILTCLEHRGAVSSDGKTGDGAGILIEIPHDFFVKQCNFNLPESYEYAVGMVFLPQKINQLNYCIDIFEKEIEKQGLNVLGWRNVPVNSKVVGSIPATTPMRRDSNRRRACCECRVSSKGTVASAPAHGSSNIGPPGWLGRKEVTS